MALDRVGELHDRGHLLHGEVGDGAEVAPAQALGGLGEGDVGLNAERCGGLAGCEVVTGDLRRLRVHHYGFATHGIVLLPALRRRMLHVKCKISSSAAMAVIDVFALENERRKKAQHRLAGAIDDDVAIHHLGSDPSWPDRPSRVPAPSIRPMPRTSTMQSWRCRELLQAAAWK